MDVINKVRPYAKAVVPWVVLLLALLGQLVAGNLTVASLIAQVVAALGASAGVYAMPNRTVLPVGPVDVTIPKV